MRIIPVASVVSSAILNDCTWATLAGCLVSDVFLVTSGGGVTPPEVLCVYWTLLISGGGAGNSSVYDLSTGGDAGGV